jgi:GNAT superfamily N-acetyltransferase
VAGYAAGGSARAWRAQSRSSRHGRTVARMALRRYARVRRNSVKGVAAQFVYLRATPEHAAELAATVATGFETYRAFAPPDWRPPAEVSSVGATRKRLADPDVWGLLARTATGAPVGHISFGASTMSRWPGGRDDLAHLWHFFVREPFWGTGVAATLHREAVAEAARQGYAEMRLYTPDRQARARRFYEREGWVVRGGPMASDLGLPLVEYRRRLPDPRPEDPT